jgi:hypothetical protein
LTISRLRPLAISRLRPFGILAVSFFAVESSCVLYSVFLGVADAVVEAVVDAASAATRR